MHESGQDRHTIMQFNDYWHTHPRIQMRADYAYQLISLGISNPGGGQDRRTNMQFNNYSHSHCPIQMRAAHAYELISLVVVVHQQSSNIFDM